MSKNEKKRCAWANTNELFIPYHDNEWGVVTHDDRLLFEMINLEGAQAGLSWLTILRKRVSYRQAFDNFDARKIARYTDSKRAQLLNNEGIVRNRLKINATIENAKAFLAIVDEFGSFNSYIWQFTDNKQLSRKDPKNNQLISLELSKALRARGFRFVGPTICYAFMQAVGLVNDHEASCYRYGEVQI